MKTMDDVVREMLADMNRPYHTGTYQHRIEYPLSADDFMRLQPKQRLEYWKGLVKGARMLTLCNVRDACAESVRSIRRNLNDRMEFELPGVEDILLGENSIYALRTMYINLCKDFIGVQQ